MQDAFADSVPGKRDGDTMKIAVKALDDEGLSHIHICPETMGKVNQLGTLE